MVLSLSPPGLPGCVFSWRYEGGPGYVTVDYEGTKKMGVCEVGRKKRKREKKKRKREKEKRRKRGKEKKREKKRKREKRKREKEKKRKRSPHLILNRK
jgi:hypothetical protein